MKSFKNIILTINWLMLLGFVQFSIAQEAVVTPKLNSLSNLFGFTGELGFTKSFTDYESGDFNFVIKDALEYYFPSSSAGNFGLRLFGQMGTISGKGGRPSWEPNNFSTKITLLGLGAFYTVPIIENIYPWVGAGVSGLWFASTFNTVFNGDAGLKFLLSKNISLNLTSGITFGGKDRLDLLEPAGSGSDIIYTGTAGLTFYFGGVDDLDSDGDGVLDSKDICKDTPPGVKVDALGCPLDSDGDGVPDYLDKCTNTPPGVRVDASGCPLDSDGDGVPDYLDKCSNTPPKATVDASGCPLDGDGDGVPDYLDKCPNTPKGIEVNSEGCHPKKDSVIIIKQTEIESLVLSGDTNFEFNKSKLLPSAYTALEGLVSTINEHPNYKWEIGGHTDAIGSDSYNKKLSKQRAQAIVDYLVSQGAKRNNLIIVGYGKDNPVATNETVEGRSMNRRVEIKLISKGTK